MSCLSCGGQHLSRLSTLHGTYSALKRTASKVELKYSVSICVLRKVLQFSMLWDNHPWNQNENQIEKRFDYFSSGTPRFSALNNFLYLTQLVMKLLVVLLTWHISWIFLGLTEDLTTQQCGAWRRGKMVGIKETRCRNCDGILFIGSFSQDQENQILDSFDTPPKLELEYDGVSRFLRCPRCSAKNLIKTGTSLTGTPFFRITGIVMDDLQLT